MSVNIEFKYQSGGKSVTRTFKREREKREKSQNSRESIGVWREDDGKYAWKLYSMEDPDKARRCDELREDYRRADVDGLPMGEPRFLNGTITRVADGRSYPSRSYPGMALIVRWFDGTNFHLTKDRHQSKPFKSALQKQNISHSKSSTDYMRIKAGCECAVAVGVQDCQGDVKAGRREPIVFIDIHRGTSTTAAEEMVEIINEWGE